MPIYHGITHPRMGYKIRTTPHDLRDAGVGGQFTYIHDDIDDPAQCRVIATTDNSEGARKYLICLVDADMLWAIHPYYHTGIDLYVQDSDGAWWAASDLDAVAAVVGTPVTDLDIARLVANRKIVPEDELTPGDFESPPDRARNDALAERTAPYLRCLTEDGDVE